MSERVGVYPGTFNPLTIAHMAVALAAREQRHLDRVVLVLSRSPINKEHVNRPLFEHRIEALQRDAAMVGWLDVAVTEHRLLVDIAKDYDVLVMGADKWAQVNDPQYYNGSPDQRDAAVAALPELAIAPRPPFPVPAKFALDVPPKLGDVSSTAVRHGTSDWMAPAAAAFDRESGAWSDPSRYDQWLKANQGLPHNS